MRMALFTSRRKKDDKKMRITSHYIKKEKNVTELRTERISWSLDYWYDFSNLFAIVKLY